MPAPAPRPCTRLLPTLQIQAQKASDSLRHRRRGRGADLRTGSWPQGRSASPPELARLSDAVDKRGPVRARPPLVVVNRTLSREGQAPPLRSRSATGIRPYKSRMTPPIECPG